LKTSAAEQDDLADIRLTPPRAGTEIAAQYARARATFMRTQ
jgi:hypothetical protein